MNITQSKELLRMAAQLRHDIITMNCFAGSGHPGGSLSAVELVTYLFWKEMNYNINNYKDQKRDRFILSKGHSCLVLYAALARKGIFDPKEYKGLRQIDSMLQGHPDRVKTPGIEFNSGSLGQGFSFALGCALGAKRGDNKFRVYTVLGDGELNEGQIWEGLMFGAFYQLDNLVAMVDYNKFQSDDLNSNVTALEPLKDKFQSFGWFFQEIDGHNFEQIDHALAQARNTKGKPSIILAHTTKGKGISFMENVPKWHGSLAPQGEEKERALQECSNRLEHLAK